jgi:uncharacterized protein involved in exopolysaccharide biosynthesis
VRRRELLAAAAAVVLVRPAAAVAADGDAEVLERLITREDAAAIAYRAAALNAVPGLAEQESDHAKALRTHLEALGGRSPSAPTDVAPLDGLDAAIALEADLVAAYGEALVELEALGILQTAATILASHAQHRALLLHAAGRDPFG